MSRRGRRRFGRPRHHRRHHPHHGHHHHHHHHGPPWRRDPWIWWAQAHLRRRIFIWFGIAILAGALAALRLGGRAHPVVIALVGLVLWMGAGAIAWSLTRPLMSIIEVTRDLGAGKMGSRLDVGRHRGELWVLAEAINDMAERIERQIADQRELLAAVSHELRTPLGHMRILLESGRERGAEPRLIDDLEHEVIEVDELVAQLLATSRLEFEALERRPLDGGEAARRALERAGVDLELLSIAGDVSCLADPTLVARALANLLGNARSHGGGVARVRVAEGAGGQVAFEVADHGPGFADGEAEKAFDRFYRGEHRAGGSLGLGLSLVRRIAEAHGGRVWAENRPSGGARVGFSIAPPGEDD